MNFVFIIDTSLSMNQTFDNISYFDYAKSSIKKFVLDREITNYKLNRSKADKYFLVSLNKNLMDNFEYNWSTNTDHFLCQLNALKTSYDFTSIDFAIKKGFQMINFIKKIGYEKHVYGRLFSKIQNSYIILITDGGHLSSSDKILNYNNCNPSTLSLKDPNQYIIEKYPNIYKELYRWDQSLYAIVLTDKNNNDFESFKVLDKICKNVGGKIITVDNPNSLNEKLLELSTKAFQNNRVYINFNINKLKKKNIITFLEYNGNIDKMNEKWPFPDELIINKENSTLPSKNALPHYEFGNIQSDFCLPPEYYDEYDIKDKKFILNTLTDGDCWNNMTLNDFIKQYKTSMTIDILVSDLKDKKIMKKPFGIICLYFSKDLIEFMKNTIFNKGNILFCKFFYDYQNYYINNNNKTSNICNFIKCKFYNLPYFFAEFINLIKKYKSQKKGDFELMEIQLNLEKYFSIIPFYYIKYIINFMEKIKIKKLFNNKESIKKIINDNFNNGVITETEKIWQLETKQLQRINNMFSENKQFHANKKADCCKKEMLYNNQNNMNLINKVDKADEDNGYFNFIDKCFLCDKINNTNKMNNINILNNVVNNSNFNNMDLKHGYKEGNIFINKNNENNHESDIDIMGDYREYYYREHLRSYLIPDIEIRYLIKDLLFGNQFLERKKAYASNQSTNNTIINNFKNQDEQIFHYLNDEDNNIKYDTNINNNNNNKINNNNYSINNKNISQNTRINNDYHTDEILDNQIKKIISEQNKENEDKEKVIKNYLINNKRNREKSMDDINFLKQNSNDSITTDISSNDTSSAPNFFSDNFSESDGSNNLLLDEFSDNKYNSKMSSLLLDEFKESINSNENDSKENKNDLKDGIKISVKYKISEQKLNKWKFQKKIKNLSQELLNSIHNDENNIIKIIKKVIDNNYYAPDKKMIHDFIEKIYFNCHYYGVNSLIQTQIKNMLKSYE